MTAAQAAVSSTEISFFGTCPTSWNSLSQAQKATCIGSPPAHQIGNHFVWIAAGELRSQWNSVGSREYNAVISARRSRHTVYLPELRLLSTSADQNTAYPFIVITSTREKAGKETIAYLQQHPRLSRFGFPYMFRLSKMIIRAGSSPETESSAASPTRKAPFPIVPPEIPYRQESSYPHLSIDGNINISQKDDDASVISLQLRNLCGAKIAVYSGSASFRNPKRSSSTIGAVLKVKGKYYALTVAHVFFGSIDTNKSWLDSGLSFSSLLDETSHGSSGLPHSEVRDPQISESYEIVVESLWPHKNSLQDDSGISRTAIGRVSPQLTHQRKTSETASLPEVILDTQLDWALIELRNPSLWEPNILMTSDGRKVDVVLPESDVSPPDGDILIAAGTSGEVHGKGLGTVGGIMLPWSTSHLETWSVEGEIAVGDSGSLVIDPQLGLAYGVVVSYDPDIMTTYIVPITAICQDILYKVGDQPSVLSKPRMLDTTYIVRETPTDEGSSKGKEADPLFQIERTQSIFNSFLSMLESCTMYNSTGGIWIKTRPLVAWMLEKVDQQASRLELLIDLAYSSEKTALIKADEITHSSKGSLVVFSLLLELKHGHLMHRFQKQGLNDGRIPFDEALLADILIESGSNSDSDASLASKLFSVQWKYCPVIFDLNIALDLPERSVLPIIQQQRINNKGASAQLWEISIPEEYVGKRLRSAVSSAGFSSASDNLGRRYQFAVKTFQQSQRHLFQNERDAFRLLQHNAFFIRCFGDYTITSQGRITHNLLLEFGDMDLREYYARTSPPSTASDIFTFWLNMCRVVEAVRDLHSIIVEGPGVEQEFHGWHHDIKPDNILTVNGHFKLSDPGFACFSKSDQEPVSVLGGTLTYGSPESASSQTISTLAGQAMDVWALGCVFSEAAVWLVAGYSGLVRYATHRETALRHLGAVNSSQSATKRQVFFSTPCFHDGIDLIPEVSKRHNDILRELRVTDTITEKILHVVNLGMLVADPEARLSAQELHDRLQMLLMEAGEEQLAEKSCNADSLDMTWLNTESRNNVQLTESFGLCISQAPQMDPTFFIGRTREIEEMHAVLESNDQSRNQRRLVLGGIGGIGKTQLAIAYAQIYSEFYTSIFWLNATSEATLKDSFRLIAKLVVPNQYLWNFEEEQVLDEVRKWLSRKTNSRWLLIFDNYDEPELYNIHQYYPFKAHGSIIITSRMPSRIDGMLFRVKTLQNIDESLEILGTRSQRSYVRSDPYARRLAERLDGLPLALATAGAYLQQTALSFEQYLEGYEKRWNIIDSPSQTILQEYGDRSLYTTWDISYRHLERENSNAAHLLRLLAYFDNQSIWCGLLQGGMTVKSAKQPLALTADVLELESRMSVLVEYSFVFAQTATQSYGIHRCVHDWISFGLNEITDTKSYWYAFDCVAASIDNGDRDIQGRKSYTHLTPHAVILTNSRYLEANWNDFVSEDQLNTVQRVAELLEFQGRLEATRKLYSRILAEYKETLGPEHKSTLKTLKKLGSLCREQGKLDEAEKIYLRALAGYEKTLGQEHPSTLEAAKNLGLLYSAQGKLKEAEEMYSRLAGDVKGAGDEHTSALQTANKLSLRDGDQGKLEQADEMYEGVTSALRNWADSELSRFQKCLDKQEDQGRDRILCFRGRKDRLTQLGSLLPTGHAHWTVSRSTNALFTGRKEILHDLETTVRNSLTRSSATDQCRIVISGIGGQGKSEICLQLANRVRRSFWGVFWVDVSTESLAEAGFLDIASRLSIPALTLDDARQGLTNLQHSWFLVLDNADDPSMDYQQYFPAGPLGVVILTSRNEECHQYASASSFALHGLAEDEARELLLKAAQVPIDQYLMLENHARAVASLLQSHPLALIQAGMYVSRGHCTLAQYPQLYAKQRKRLLTFQPTQARSRYKDIYATFEASADVVEALRTEASRDAMQLLSILATCGASQLPLPLFEAGWKGAQTIDANSPSDDDLLRLTPWHVSRLPPLVEASASVWDSFRLIEAIHLLKAFSFVSVDAHEGSISVSMHPLVHSWARDRQGTTQQHESWVATGCLFAISSIDHNFWLKYGRKLQSHLRALTQRDLDGVSMSEPSENLISILMNCGWRLSGLRDDATLFTMMQNLFSYIGLDRAKVESRWLPIYDLAAKNLVNYGKVTEGVSILEQVVKIREYTPVEDDPSRLASQHALAGAYLVDGQVREAVSLLEQVVKIQEQTLAKDHPDRLASLHALAEVYRANGQVKEAVSLLEQVVKIQEQTLAKDHPDRLASQHALAEAYRVNGQIKEAVSLLEQVVKIREQTLAKDHPSRLASQHALAGAYRVNGQVKEAISLLEQVVKIEEQILAKDHPSRLASQHALAGAYQANGQVMEAVSLLEQVVKIRDQTLAEDHPARLASQLNLAIMFWEIGRRDSALQMLKHVVGVQRQVLDENHPHRTNCETWLKYFEGEMRSA